MARTSSAVNASETMPTKRTGFALNSVSHAASSFSVSREWSCSGRKKTKTFAFMPFARRWSLRPSSVGQLDVVDGVPDLDAPIALGPRDAERVAARPRARGGPEEAREGKEAGRGERVRSLAHGGLSSSAGSW